MSLNYLRYSWFIFFPIVSFYNTSYFFISLFSAYHLFHVFCHTSFFSVAAHFLLHANNFVTHHMFFLSLFSYHLFIWSVFNVTHHHSFFLNHECLFFLPCRHHIISDIHCGLKSAILGSSLGSALHIIYITVGGGKKNIYSCLNKFDWLVMYIKFDWFKTVTCNVEY